MALNLTVPVVLVGRFTTFAGADSFETVPIAVSEFSEIDLTVWRGVLEDAGDQFTFEIQESMDQENWTQIGIVTPSGAGQVSLSADLSRSYLKAIVKLASPGGGFPVITAWVAGFLLKRRA